MNIRARGLWHVRVPLALSVLLAVSPCSAEIQLFDSGGLSPDQEVAQLTAVLESDAPLFDKMLACKRLAVVGDEQAVPTLAALLADEDLSHSARYALEAIPGPTADKALVDALATTSGRQLVGVINSLGVRRNADAVVKLGELLGARDGDAAAAAAEALAAIGNLRAGGYLLEAIKTSPAARQSALQDAGLRCAERLAASNRVDDAQLLYEALSADSSPRAVRLAAELGLLRLTPDANFPSHLERSLKSADDVEQEAAITAAQERNDSRVTSVLAAALAGASERQQVRLLDGLASRSGSDSRVAAQVADVARRGTPAVRVAALACLGRVGDPTIVPLLVAAAADANRQIAATAAESLEALPGEKVDDAVLQQLADARPTERRVVVAVLGRRGVKAATPAFFKLLDSDDSATRLAALEALGQTVDEGAFAKLVDHMVSITDPAEREATIAAVNAACRRMPDADAVVAIVGDRLKTWPADDRPRLFGVLGAVGGKSALEVVAAAAEDDSPDMADAATRTLGRWMTPDAAPVLLKIAAADHPYKIRALRGYLRIARQLNLTPQERLRMCEEALRIAQRPDERRLVLQVLPRCASPQAAAIAVRMLEEPALRPQAAETLVVIAERIRFQDPAAASAVARQALDAGLTDDLSQRAQRLLNPN